MPIVRELDLAKITQTAPANHEHINPDGWYLVKLTEANHVWYAVGRWEWECYGWELNSSPPRAWPLRRRSNIALDDKRIIGIWQLDLIVTGQPHVT